MAEINKTERNIIFLSKAARLSAYLYSRNFLMFKENNEIKDEFQNTIQFYENLPQKVKLNCNKIIQDLESFAHKAVS